MSHFWNVFGKYMALKAFMVTVKISTVAALDFTIANFKIPKCTSMGNMYEL